LPVARSRAVGHNGLGSVAYAPPHRVPTKCGSRVARDIATNKGVLVFLIFGLRTKAVRMGLAAATCRVCGQAGSLLLVRESTKFSLFFIPLVTIRTKYVLQCMNPVCGARTAVDAGQARRLLAAGTGSLR
jgi:hypothetical protein